MMTIFSWKIIRKFTPPPELQLNLENSGDTINFLDLSLTNNNGHIDVKLYDKRDNFPFSIVRLLFASSNIPSRVFYKCMGTEILRIGRVCSNVENFIQAGKDLDREGEETMSKNSAAGKNFEKNLWTPPGEFFTAIKRLNKRNSLRSMSTFDFSTLYTKIPKKNNRSGVKFSKPLFKEALEYLMNNLFFHVWK